MVCVWFVYGLCMVCVWFVHGLGVLLLTDVAASSMLSLLMCLFIVDAIDF